MACFLVPAAEAVVATVIERRAARGVEPKTSDPTSLPWATKLRWLTNMLWGGALLLALEHLWHGEISPLPPFLTALKSADQTALMGRELATVGLGMAVVTTLAWVAMVVAVDRLPALRRAVAPQAAATPRG
ncbi:MAG: hypothetical protein LBK42_07945 [Propionibacteriaceae bacterium]|jgi:hypothetical protein|nr:hypothetical protein [Propionibacteriaceae bacterium]